MRDINIQFCQIQLREAREEARRLGVQIPNRLTALRSSVRGWFLVEGDGFRKEVTAHNAYDAKYKVISALIEKAAQ
jgi:hypothetical protein